MSDLSYLLRILPALLQGLEHTLFLFAVTLLLALPLGLLCTLGSLSTLRPLRWLAQAYILLFRGTPLMLQLFFIYFGLPFVGLTLDRMPAAVLTFALNYTAYFAEIYRAGIQSIDSGQYDAAKALGLSRWQTLRFIILPQTVGRILPPVCNETITLVKDTALVTAIGVAELLQAASSIVNRDINVTAYLLAALAYLLLTLLFTTCFQQLERHCGRYLQTEA